ncbi:50S ribosomal protein L10 [Candidatus Zinderia endosymbiont of Aphrophora alni]|uniref:50S ribosomal protein L10 n=1 Tax=Candidatus Zinderia endosymbiont of Aphrophora alni TaxID=3077951 RepID=UPI0030D45D1C
MNFNIDKKKKIVSKIIEKINIFNVIILAKFKKISTNQLTDLRVIFKKKKIFISVFKNSLLKKALIKSKFEKIISKINGQIICFFSNDVILLSKVIIDFLKINKNLIVKIGSFFEKKIFLLDIKNFANIPSKNVLLMQLFKIFRYSIINFIKILFFIKNKKK